MVPLLLLLLSMMPAAAAANWTVLTISGRRHSPGVRTAGGATVTTNPLLVLRSGSPNTTSSATLSAVLAPGVTIDALGFSFSFEMGYGDGASAACGAQLNVTVAGKTAYASPMLSGYPYSRTKDPGLYSPPPSGGGDAGPSRAGDAVQPRGRLSLPQPVSERAAAAPH